MLLPEDKEAQEPSSGGERADAPEGHRGARRRRWVVAVCAILLAGLAASLAAALLWRSTVRARERQSFQTEATNVSGQLDTLLRRDTDFVRAVRAAMTMQPNLSASGFREWSAQLEDHEAALGAYGALVVKSVPAGELASFQARRDVDPAFRELVGGRVEPVAVSGQPSYCLLAGGSADIRYSVELSAILQGDWCDPSSFIGSYRQNGTTRARFTQTVTDSGHFLAYLAPLPGVSALILEGAYYRRGAPLATVAQRRAAVRGWVLGSFEVGSLLNAALHGDRRLAITLYHVNPGTTNRELIGRYGARLPAHPLVHSSALGLDGTWLVDVAGTPDVDGPSASLQAIVVFVGGLVATMLLFALVLVLARSRERALAMVEEKTGQLRHQALHDALTGLPNRVLALDRAEQMLARARRQQIPVAALYVDVDGFKDVNDSFGHAAGDQLLRIVAKRLQEVVREGDTAARLGGDEFVVLVEGSTLDDGPELVAERLLEALRKPYDMRQEIGRELSLTASIGIAFGLRGSADELLRDADIALYTAKGSGKDRHVLFHTDMQNTLQDRLTLEMELLDALEQGQLLLLYQPTYDLQTRKLVGVQARVRWRHPQRGVLEPREFMATAEKSGAIGRLWRWALREACSQAAEWQARDLGLGVSVQVPVRQLEDEELAREVAGALDDTGLQPGLLTLEVSETALLRDADTVLERLGSLRRLGVRIAIDGFAAGYASVAQWRELPVDALKVQRSFIDGLAGSGRETALLDTFVQLGRTLRMETLADGVLEQGPAGESAAGALDATEVEALVAGARSAAQPQPSGR